MSKKIPYQTQAFIIYDEFKRKKTCRGIPMETKLLMISLPEKGNGKNTFKYCL